LNAPRTAEPTSAALSTPRPPHGRRYGRKAVANGEAVIRGVPEGAAKLTVGRSDLKAARNEVARNIVVKAGAPRETMTIELRGAAR